MIATDNDGVLATCNHSNSALELDIVRVGSEVDDFVLGFQEKQRQHFDKKRKPETYIYIYI